MGLSDPFTRSQQRRDFGNAVVDHLLVPLELVGEYQVATRSISMSKFEVTLTRRVSNIVSEETSLYIDYQDIEGGLAMVLGKLCISCAPEVELL